MQDPPSGETGETVLKQTMDEGKSQQEQPSELSWQELVDKFIGFIADASIALDQNIIAYGEPGFLLGVLFS